MIPQNDKYQENQTMFKYSHKYLYFALKKKPYGIIEFNKIEKVEKIATDIGLPVLIKVYTKDGEIHYIGNNELQGAFLYALKERGLKDLVEEERRGISFIRRYILRLKGGKVVKR